MVKENKKWAIKETTFELKFFKNFHLQSLQFYKEIKTWSLLSRLIASRIYCNIYDHEKFHEHSLLGLAVVIWKAQCNMYILMANNEIAYSRLQHEEEENEGDRTKNFNAAKNVKEWP